MTETVFWGIPLILWISAPLIGLVGMFSGGFWGVGCSWFIVPTMLLLGLSPMEAVGIALLQMIPSTLPIVVKTAGEIGWGRHSLGRMILLPLAVGAFFASFAGSPINSWMNSKFGDKGLLVLFFLIMAFIGVQTLRGRPAAEQGSPTSYDGRSGVLAFLAGLGVGVFSSVLGVGGAVLIRPTLASGFKASEHDTSVALRILLLVTTFTGGVTYLFGDGGFQTRILLLTVLISIGGAISFSFGVKIHDVVVRCGYACQVHKSFALISLIVIVSTILKLTNHPVLSRYVMFGFAALLTASILLFGIYAKRHPRTAADR